MAPRFENVFALVTRACDQRCRFCYLGTNGDAPHPPVAELAAQLAGARVECGGSMALLSGGEATLHPGLLDLLEAARAAGFPDIYLFSNGVRLGGEPRLASELARRGVGGVMISLHGSSPQVHDDLVGRPHFAAALGGIEAALAAGLEVTVTTVASALNLADIAATNHLLRERFPSVYAHRISFPAALGRARATPELLPRYEEVAALVRTLAAVPASVRVMCELVPLCLLADTPWLAVEHGAPARPDLRLDRPADRYQRVGARPCFECAERAACRGLQQAVVLRHGAPRGYVACRRDHGEAA